MHTSDTQNPAGKLCLLPGTQLYLVVSSRPHPQGHNGRSQPWLNTTESGSCQHGRRPDSNGSPPITAVSPHQTLRTRPGPNGQLCNVHKQLCPTDAKGSMWRSRGVDSPRVTQAAPVLSMDTPCIVAHVVSGKCGKCHGLLAKRVLASALANGVQTRW